MDNKKVEHLRYWVQKILPLVYDDSLSYYELLNRVVVKLNETIDVANVTQEHIEEEVTRILNEWYEDGRFDEIIGDMLDNIDDRMTQLESDFGQLSTDVDTRIDGVEGDVENINTSIGEINGDIDDINNNIGDINGDIDGIRNDITQLSNDLDDVSKNQFVVSGKNIAFFGDSWTVGSGATNPATQRFTTLIANRFQMVEKNFGVGAAGFTRPLTFMAQLENANSNLSADDKSNTTVVLICGGVNDIRNMGDTTLADFLGAVVACQERAKEIFPNALICMAVGTTMKTPYYDTARYWVEQAIMTLRDTNTSGKVLIIDHVGASINGRGNTYASDDLHPNTYGHSLLAGFLANAIRGGSTCTDYYYGVCTYNSVVTDNTTPHFFRQTENVMITNGKLTLNEAVSSNTVIGSYSGPFQRENLYIPVYHSNNIVGSLAITASGSVRLIPLSGTTFNTGWELLIPPVSFLFNTYI